MLAAHKLFDEHPNPNLVRIWFTFNDAGQPSTEDDWVDFHVLQMERRVYERLVASPVLFTYEMILNANVAKHEKPHSTNKRDVTR